QSLKSLEALVEELERGDLPLERAMQKFEEGIRLTRACEAALKDAEQRVEILLKNAGGAEVLREFEVDDGSSQGPPSPDLLPGSKKARERDPAPGLAGATKALPGAGRLVEADGRRRRAAGRHQLAVH